MLLYLDMCCLKRPFDDQSQPRVRLETEAVLALLASEPKTAQFVRSPALFLENAQNPVAERAARVNAWLAHGATWQPDAARLRTRTAELIQLGLRNFDALHAASAEQAGAVALGTCDDRFLNAARRDSTKLRVKVVGVVELASEVLV